MKTYELNYLMLDDEEFVSFLKSIGTIVKHETYSNFGESCYEVFLVIETDYDLYSVDYIEYDLGRVLIEELV